MRIKLLLLLVLLFISNELVFGKNENKSKKIKSVNNKHETNKKENKTRLRRSLDDDIDSLFVPGKDFSQYDHNLQERGRTVKLRPIVEKEPPFWGTRGRRDSASDETVTNLQLPTYNHHKGKIKNLQKLLLAFDGKHRRDEAESPFWGNRGRRNSDESDENDIDLFWANRGRRQDEEPFWGTRGRREEDSPFWGNRGRRDDDEPFWGNRGRRQEPEPFWGTRGRRETLEPFWGSRGKKKMKNQYINKDAIEPFWGNRAKLKEKFKNYIIEALENVQDNINNLSKLKRNDMPSPFWMNRGRDSKLKHLFNGATRDRLDNMPSITISKTTGDDGRYKLQEPNTVHNDRIYAEEPRYILVERNSRSSLEEDPFYISRGKKYSAIEIVKDTRNRRGALEELVKSVRNDPYYIARGKKDSDPLKTENSSSLQDQLLKTKDLVCSTVDLTSIKHEGNIVKRETSDNERDRRTTLKKLALQLQMDPYFVSRGKKSESHSSSDLEQFINNIKALCN